MRRLALALLVVGACADHEGPILRSPIGDVVGDARVVGLGEATHGTHEFYDLKRQFIEYLVAARGFTIVAFEAPASECTAINDYVVSGAGDAVTALRGVSFWTLRTEEVLQLIEWLRAWNANPAHATVRVVGIDTKPLTRGTNESTARLEIRDRAMAESVVGSLASGRTIVWAHNGHVTFGGEGMRSMGRELRERLGDDYVAVGFLFGHGSFRAVEQDDKAQGPVVVTVAPKAHNPGLSSVAVDLRSLPADGAVHDWFHAPHAFLQSGAVFASWAPRTVLVLPSHYDAVVYVDATTPTRPLAGSTYRR